MIVDASALVELLLERAGAHAARDAIADLTTLQAPHLIQTEVLHALRNAVLRKEVSPTRAQVALDDLAALPIIHHTHSPLNRRVWGLRHNFTAYDATYVVLADVLDMSLLTADGPLARAADRLIDVILV